LNLESKKGYTVCQIALPYPWQPLHTEELIGTLCADSHAYDLAKIM